MAERANEFGETGEAKRLRDIYNAEKDPVKKAEVRIQLGNQRKAQGITSADAKKAGGLLGLSSKFNYAPDTAGKASKNQLELNQAVANANANMNRLDETTPFGKSEYTQNADGTWSRNTTLSDDQNIVNKYQTLTDQSKYYGAFQKSQEAERQLANPYDLSGQPKVYGADDLLGSRQKAENSVYDSFARRNEPLFAQQQKSYEQKMADRGIPMGAQQYSAGMRDMNNAQNDARLNAQATASQMGMQEMQGLQGMSLQNRQQGIGEYEAQRYAPMNESNMFLSGARGVVSPQVSATSQVDVGNVDLASNYLGYNPKMSGGGGSSGSGGYSFSSLGGLQNGYLTNYANPQQGSSNGGTANIVTGISNGVANGFLSNLAGSKKIATKSNGLLGY
jgi:hypothetical protein